MRAPFLLTILAFTFGPGCDDGDAAFEHHLEDLGHHVGLMADMVEVHGANVLDELDLARVLAEEARFDDHLTTVVADIELLLEDLAHASAGRHDERLAELFFAIDDVRDALAAHDHAMRGACSVATAHDDERLFQRHMVIELDHLRELATRPLHLEASYSGER